MNGYSGIYSGASFYNRQCDPCCNPCQPYQAYNNCQPCIQPCIQPCPTPAPVCPNVTFITSATTPFSIATTPVGTVPTPVPIGATSLPVGSTIIPIIGSNLVANPETNAGGISFTPGTGQFTVPVAGRYLISAYFSFAAVPVGTTLGVREVYIYRVDAATGIITLLAADSRNATVNGPTNITVTTAANLNVGDRIFFAASQNTGAALDIFPTANPANRFVITRLC